MREYKSSLGRVAREDAPNENGYALLQADGSYRLGLPAIQDGVLWQLRKQ